MNVEEWWFRYGNEELDKFSPQVLALGTWDMADEYLPKEWDAWDLKTLRESQVSIQRRQERLQ